MVLIYVGIGGAVGSICRYLLSLIPIQSSFPLITLVTNFIGAIFIGIIVEGAASFTFPQSAMPLLKTGFCGGFTTFSTFSLETITLMETGQYLIGGAYAFLSFLLCLTGVILGKGIVHVMHSVF